MLGNLSCKLILQCLSASVFSVSVDPVNSSMAVSGGEDDKAYVWRIQDGETHMECLGKFINSWYTCTVCTYASSSACII